MLRKIKEAKSKEAKRNIKKATSNKINALKS
jgi:hypothetical protein